MKRIYILSAGLLAIIAGTAFSILSDNGKAGYTGSPGELVCNDCHNTFGAPNSGSGEIYVTSNMNNWQYVPGQTYTINVIVKQTGRGLFGLGFEALTSANANAGILQITNSARTQIKTKTVNNVVRNNVVHQFNGGQFNDSSVFTFNWSAPNSNIGNITLYFAGVAANGNGDEFGDYVYKSTKLVTPASATGISEADAKDGLKAWFRGKDMLRLEFNAGETEPLVELYDLRGSLICSRRFSTGNSGNVSLDMEMPIGLQEGVYVVNVNTGEKLLSEKVYMR